MLPRTAGLTNCHPGGSEFHLATPCSTILRQWWAPLLRSQYCRSSTKSGPPRREMAERRGRALWNLSRHNNSMCLADTSLRRRPHFVCQHRHKAWFPECVWFLLAESVQCSWESVMQWCDRPVVQCCSVPAYLPMPSRGFTKGWEHQPIAALRLKLHPSTCSKCCGNTCEHRITQTWPLRR